MTESIILDVSLQAFVRGDTPQRWIATCPMVGVVTQGKSAADARRCLQQAIELWFESCVERGVLEQALREANFQPSHADHESRRKNGIRQPRLKKGRSASNILGEPFEVHLTIPAYEAPALLGATA
jgi:predicted RNase H-like HicB family nuclease